jgi:hypothetical protein
LYGIGEGGGGGVKAITRTASAVKNETYSYFSRSLSSDSSMIVSGFVSPPDPESGPTGPGLLLPVTRPLPFRSTAPEPRFRPPFNRNDSRKDARARLTVNDDKMEGLVLFLD